MTFRLLKLSYFEFFEVNGTASICVNHVERNSEKGFTFPGRRRKDLDKYRKIHFTKIKGQFLNKVNKK